MSSYAFTFSPAPDSIGYGLGSVAPRVWGKMQRYERGADRVCKVSQARMAHELGIGRNALRKAITALEHAGWVKDLTPDAPKGKPHRYRVADLGSWEGAWMQALLQKARDRMGDQDAFRGRKWETMSLIPNLVDALALTCSESEQVVGGTCSESEQVPAPKARTQERVESTAIQKVPPPTNLPPVGGELANDAEKASTSFASVPSKARVVVHLPLHTNRGGEDETQGLEPPPEDYLRKAAAAFRAGLAPRKEP